MRVEVGLQDTDAHFVMVLEVEVAAAVSASNGGAEVREVLGTTEGRVDLDWILDRSQ